MKSNTQEVRAANDSVVVPSDLNLPKDAEVQKYAAHMLGLSFPFPTCSGDCSLSHRCFARHTMEEHEKQCVLFARFTLLWRHWKAHMSMRRCLAEERVLAGLSAPVIRDVASVRSYVAGIVDNSSAFRCLEKLFCIEQKEQIVVIMTCCASVSALPGSQTCRCPFITLN